MGDTFIPVDDNLLSRRTNRTLLIRIINLIDFAKKTVKNSGV